MIEQIFRQTREDEMSGRSVQSIRQSRQRGFSLIEMIITMAIMMIILGSVYLFMHQNQNVFIVEAARVDLHQNLRTAVEVLSMDIQAAGGGMPQFLGPIAGKDGGTDGGGLPMLDANGFPLTDQILLIYGDQTFPQLSVKTTPASASAPIEVFDPVPGPAPAFTVGEVYVLYTVAQANVAATPDLARYQIFRLQSFARNAANDGTILNPINPVTTVALPNWQNSFPTAASLKVTRLDRWIVYRLDRAKNELQRSINGEAWRMAARHITDLQFWYWIEPGNPAVASFQTNEPGVIDNDHRALIRSVGIQIRAETEMMRVPDALGQRALTQDTIISPRNLTLPGFVLNH